MEKECCPKFNPEPWENKTFTWEDKLFVKDKILTVFHIPLNFGGVMTKLVKKIELAGANMLDGLCLSDYVSGSKMNVYLAVDKEIPNIENVKLSGKFFSRVYEGNFKDTGKWCKDFEEYTRGQSLTIKKLYMWYTTCPKCAKKYGKNYVVIVGQIE